MILYRENMRFARERKKSENFHFCEREREREISSLFWIEKFM